MLSDVTTGTKSVIKATYEVRASDKSYRRSKRNQISRWPKLSYAGAMSRINSTKSIVGRYRTKHESKRRSGSELQNEHEWTTNFIRTSGLEDLIDLDCRDVSWTGSEFNKQSGIRATERVGEYNDLDQESTLRRRSEWRTNRIVTRNDWDQWFLRVDDQFDQNNQGLVEYRGRSLTNLTKNRQPYSWYARQLEAKTTEYRGRSLTNR